MKKIEIHLKNEKSKTGKTLSKSKTMAISNFKVSKQRFVSSGGLINVEINLSHMAGDSIKIMSASSKNENTHGLFVAGGDKIDQLVDSANEKIELMTERIAVKKKGLAVIKDYLSTKVKR